MNGCWKSEFPADISEGEVSDERPGKPGTRRRRFAICGRPLEIPTALKQSTETVGETSHEGGNFNAALCLAVRRYCMATQDRWCELKENNTVSQFFPTHSGSYVSLVTTLETEDLTLEAVKQGFLTKDAIL